MPLKRGKTYGPIPNIVLPNGKTLIRQQIDSILLVYPNAEIISVIGFEADKLYRVQPESCTLIENECHTLGNVVRSISMGLRQCSYDNVIMIHGDILFDEKFIASLSIQRSSIVVDRYSKQEIGVNILNGNVESWGFGLPNRWMKVVHLHQKELDVFRKQVFDRNKSNLFTYEILSNITNSGGNFVPTKSDGLIIEMENYLDSIVR
jgi:choline kinase